MSAEVIRRRHCASGSANELAAPGYRDLKPGQIFSGVRLGPLKGPLDITLPEPALAVRDELAELPRLVRAALADRVRAESGSG
jgi:hypothetical protein